MLAVLTHGNVYLSEIVPYKSYISMTNNSSTENGWLYSVSVIDVTTYIFLTGLRRVRSKENCALVVISKRNC